jgi:sulfide dehydrogenase [flavocytochrome c] flavoprotein subunit
VIHDTVTEIDPVAKKVSLQGGDHLSYDRAVVSPGIGFHWDAIEAYDEAASEFMPHAWQAGRQTLALRKQLQAMPDGGTAIVVPPISGFYRCPPGPYERASLMAHYLKQHKPRSKVVILDAREKFSKWPLFFSAWKKLYPDMIEFVPPSKGGLVQRVEAEKGLIHTADGESHHADVASVIPPQKAAHIAELSDLVDESGWCPVDALAFESTRHSGIHVIGDSAIASPMPKSGYAANSQAKVVALAVVAYLNGDQPGLPSLINTCFSFIAPDYSVSISGVYGRDEKGQLIQRSGARSTIYADVEAEARYARSWYKNIMADTFG